MTAKVITFEKRYKWKCDQKGCANKAVADKNGNIYFCRKHLGDENE